MRRLTPDERTRVEGIREHLEADRLSPAAPAWCLELLGILDGVMHQEEQGTRCTSCNGSGSLPPSRDTGPLPRPCPTCPNGQRLAATLEAEGLRLCPRCDGEGTTPTYVGHAVVCTMCQGDGTLTAE